MSGTPLLVDGLTRELAPAVLQKLDRRCLIVGKRPTLERIALHEMMLRRLFLAGISQSLPESEMKLYLLTGTERGRVPGHILHHDKMGIACHEAFAIGQGEIGGRKPGRELDRRLKGETGLVDPAHL